MSASDYRPFASQRPFATQPICSHVRRCLERASFESTSTAGAPPFLCTHHFHELYELDLTTPAPIPTPTRPAHLAAVYDCTELKHTRLKVWFGEFLVMRTPQLARLKGDWKRCLTGKVIHLIRRWGIMEEQELPGLGWMKAYRAILRQGPTLSEERAQAATNRGRRVR